MSAASPNLRGNAVTQTHYHAFLSHNGADKPAVRDLAAKLEERCIACWLEPFSIKISIGLSEIEPSFSKKCGGNQTGMSRAGVRVSAVPILDKREDRQSLPNARSERGTENPV